MGDPAYKLTYFNARGLTEPIRYIFAFAGVAYEDVRLQREDWPAVKPTTPWGQVPVLEFEGVTIAQSSAIARFLARKFNLEGATALEAAKCDELVEAVGDLKWEWRKFFFEAEESRKAELKKALAEVHMVKYFGKFEELLGEGEGRWLVGAGVTWADLFVACYLDTVEQTVEAGLLEAYPRLKALKVAVEDLPKIKAWIESRPLTAN